MRFPEFEAMTGPARQYPELWRLALGLGLILFVYAGTLALQAAGLFVVVGPMGFFGWLQRLNYPTEAVPTLMLLGTFAGLFLGPILAAAALHFRGPGSLFGPADETLRGFLVAMLVAVPLYALLLGAGSLADPPAPNLPWGVWAGWLPYALPLILLQVTAEELVFRGYLQQQLAARFRARWIWLGIPAALFAALHWNPQAGHLVWLILLATFTFGLVAGDLTARTGSLGAAIALHFVNNLFGLLVISVSGTITGLARWVTPFSLAEPGPLAFSLLVNIAFMVALWRLVRWALDR